MKKLLLFLTFGFILNGDQVDEMEELILNHESLIIHPEKLYKDGGIWLTETKTYLLLEEWRYTRKRIKKIKSWNAQL